MSPILRDREIVPAGIERLQTKQVRSNFMNDPPPAHSLSTHLPNVTPLSELVPGGTNRWRNSLQPRRLQRTAGSRGKRVSCLFVGVQFSAKAAAGVVTVSVREGPFPFCGGCWVKKTVQPRPQLQHHQRLLEKNQQQPRQQRDHQTHQREHHYDGRSSFLGKKE